MRTAHILLLAIFVASASWASAALVHESTFNQSTGTDPVAAGDATFIWAVNQDYTGGPYGHYSYTGTGQLELVSPSVAGQDNQDPFLEYNTSDTLTGSDFQIVLDCAPVEWSAARANQGLVLAMTDAATGNSSTWSSGEIALVVCNRWGHLRLYFTDTPSLVHPDYNLKYVSQRQVVTSLPADLTNLRLILTYNHTTSQYKAYWSENGGDIQEIPQTFTVTHTMPVVNVTLEQWYSSLGYDEHAFTLDDLAIYNSISVTSGTRAPLQERTFDAEDDLTATGTEDPFWEINVTGDLNSEYSDDAVEYQYNDVGQFSCGVAAAPTGYPNAHVSFLSPVSAATTQIAIDLTPHFTNDGILQMFNIWLGSDLAIFIANSDGTGDGVGIFAWQDNIYSLLPSDAAKIPIPAGSIQNLRLVVTHTASPNQTRLYWGINGGPLHEHPKSPHMDSAPRTFTDAEFQWQVWAPATNPSAFAVGLDNIAEYDYVSFGEPPTAASPSWDLYR